jgi:hypothetical protein
MINLVVMIGKRIGTETVWGLGQDVRGSAGVTEAVPVPTIGRGSIRQINEAVEL